MGERCPAAAVARPLPPRGEDRGHGVAGAARHRGAPGKRPHALLRAQHQRVAVARALVTTPTVLFADEPTATLYPAERAEVLRTLTAAARSHGITVVLATHDAEVATLADRASRSWTASASTRLRDRGRGGPGGVPALRLARGTHPLVLLRRLLVPAASAGVGFLLLCTLG